MEIKLKDGRILYKSQAKQTSFHNLIENRLQNGFRKFLYGGAAGGGKSEALRWQAVKHCLEYPGLRVLIIRSSYPELDRTHIARLQIQLPAGWGTYNDQKKRYTFKTGSIIQFGHGEHKRDFKKYLSDEYDVIMIDELTTIPFDLVILLISRLRASRKGFVTYFAAGTNPGDISHIYVKAYFIDKNFKEKFPEMVDEYYPDTISFTPARIFDNKIYLERDPDALKKLSELSPNDRKRFLEGSWDIFEGQFFDKLTRTVHEIPHIPVQEDWNYALTIDYGSTTTGYFGFRDRRDNVYYASEWTEIGKTTSEKAQSFVNWLKKLCERYVKIEEGLTAFQIKQKKQEWYRRIKAYGDSDMFALQREIDSKTTPAAKFQEKLKAEEIPITLQVVSKRRMTADKFRIFCNEYFKDNIDWKRDANGLWLRKPKLYTFPGLLKFWDTIPLLQTDPENDRDILQTSPKIDHWYDAAKYLLINLKRPSSEDEVATARKVVDRLISMKK